MRIRSAACLAAVAIVLAATGCRTKLTQPPYASDPPPVRELMDATEAQLQTIQVPKAKIHEARRPGAGLELVAEAPASFAGRIHIGGNELLQLAVNPEEYALRLVEPRISAMPPGFYTGPPSQCAVETLIGVSMSAEQLTALLLGGGPVIEGPLEVVSQKWSRSRARELIQLRTPAVEQELEFAWENGRWWFAGASLWQRSGDDLTWLWTIRHEKLHTVDGVVLPSRTVVRQPTATRKRRKRRRKKDALELVIDYSEQVVNPPIAGGGQGGDTWDDEWEDEDGWEDEDSPESASSTEPPAPETDQPATEVAPAIAPAFRLDGAGLTPRGDLCRTP